MTEMTPVAPRVFVSYSHSDKRVARRLARRLTAHGIDVRIDERALRLGAELGQEIRNHIDGSDVLVVVASEASAASRWVGMELSYARESGTAVVPLLVEPVAGHERFENTLGIDVTSPQAFAEGLYGLIAELYAHASREPVAPEHAKLEAGLRELAEQEPDLEPLISGCLDSEGLHDQNLDTVLDSAFHPLDETLDSLFELRPTSATAQHAAYGFCQAGAGTRALASWIARTGNGDGALVTAVGNNPLDPALLGTAIRLLGACDPPNEQALYNFIDKNAAQLDPAQRRAVIRLVTWPVRPPEGLGDVTGSVALKHFPESEEIHRLWSRWIRDGCFDGEPHGPRQLAQDLWVAHQEDQAGWTAVEEALRSHVRSLLRSGDKAKVTTAMDHVRAAADKGLPVLSTLLREAEGVSGTAEWNRWRERDPEVAEWAKWYVHAVTKEARQDRDWLRAFEEADRMVAFQRERQRRLSE